MTRSTNPLIIIIIIIISEVPTSLCDRNVYTIIIIRPHRSTNYTLPIVTETVAWSVGL